MLNSEPAVLLITVLLFVAALAVSFFLGTEIVRVLRDFFAQQGSRAPESDAPQQVSAQQAAARRNRATVERLINKFEEGEPRPAARPKE